MAFTYTKNRRNKKRFNNNGFTMPVTPANGNGGFFGGDGWWVIIIFALIFGWGGNGRGGNNGGSVADQYVLASDFATLQRQIDSSTDRLAQQGNQIANGLCDGFYTQAQLVNGVNANITQAQITGMQNTNAIQTQLSNMSATNQACCCETQRQIERGFADTNYNIATQECQTRQAIADSTKSILDYLCQDKINALTSENQALRLRASQEAQNNYLISQLRPFPVASYSVPNPYAGTTCPCGC